MTSCTHKAGFLVRLCLASLVAGSGSTAAGGPPKPPQHPARISVAVDPSPVKAGSEAQVTISLEPIAGVKINRYPQVRVQVARQSVLRADSQGAVGDSTPPAAGEGEAAVRYFDKVEPLHLVLDVDPEAPAGPHEVEGKLVYYYCIPDEFCAPHRATVKIPLSVQ